MFSTNYRLTRAYARRMLMREEQRVGPSTPSTGLKRKVSILPIYVWHMLTICVAWPDPPRQPQGVSLAIYPPLKGQVFLTYTLYMHY
jgi:hypothetical protein